MKGLVVYHNGLLLARLTPLVYIGRFNYTVFCVVHSLATIKYKGVSVDRSTLVKVYERYFTEFAL